MARRNFGSDGLADEKPASYVSIEGRTVDTGCAWSEFGQQCTDRGVWSEGTNGEGPWWCRVHEAQRHGRPVQARATQQTQQAGGGVGPRREGETSAAYAVRAMVWLRPRLASLQADAASTSGRKREWSRAILDRYADGEIVADISLRYACAAMDMTVESVRALRETA